MRKLATIRKINLVEEIPGADRICTYVVGGWNIVDSINKYKVNDFVIMCELDSFVPTEVAPFLTQPGHFPKEYQGIKGERLRTKKLKGVVSQGLLLPLETLTKFPSEQWFDVEPFEGSDVTSLLGIIKWEPPAEFRSTDAKGTFPSFIPKTDQERIQNLSKQFEKYKVDGSEWEITEKLDGSSMTVYFKDGEVGVCSRNLELKEDLDNTFWKTAIELGVVDKLKNLQRNLALQGELIGPGIQGNKYNLQKHEYRIYDIFNIDTQKYMLPEDRFATAISLDLDHCPVIDIDILKFETISDVLTYAEGKSELNHKTEREGLVFKQMNSDISFKAISNKWLLKFE